MTREELIESYEKAGKPTSLRARNGKYKWLWDGLLELYPWVDTIRKATFKHFIFALYEDIKEPPICKMCPTPISAANDHGFMDYCSVKCAANCPDTQKKRKDTSIEKYGTTHHLKNPSQLEKQRKTVQERYGVDFISQCEEFQDSVKKTNLERYGSETYFFTDDFKAKVEKTSRERYGVHHYASSPEVKKKRQQTMLERHGASFPSQVPEFADKARQTMIEKYGVENYSQTEEFGDKIRNISMGKYGCEHFLSSDKVKNRRYETNIERYGKAHYMQTEESAEKRRIASLEKYGTEFTTQRNMPPESLIVLSNPDILKEHYDRFPSIRHASDDLMISPSTYGRYLKDYNIEIVVPVASIAETEILEVLLNYGVSRDQIITSDRNFLGKNGAELDIHIPSLGVAIEYNGMYWHSDAYRKDSYHQDKTLLATERGIRLLHIWEYDWVDPVRRKIIEGKIRHLLGISNRRVFARKTRVTKVDAKTSRKFMVDNHIQGAKNSTAYYGLMTGENEMVACLSVKLSGGVVEISRYATSCSVVGGFSKLLKKVKEDFSGVDILSYCSLDYGTGVMYEKAGFVKVGVTSPNYRYTKGSSVYSREKFMKHKLPKLLENFDPSLTERENMRNHGYLRIYDAGSIKYVMKNPSQ